MIQSTMAFHHLFTILIFLTVAMVAGHVATSSPELYWKYMLPNTPMPKAIKDLLRPDFIEEKTSGTSVTVGKGTGVNVNTGKGKHGRGGTIVNVGGKGGGVTVGSGSRGKPVHVGVGRLPFDYVYAATETQIHDDPNVALFFLENDLHKGKTMKLHFSESLDRTTLLPRRIAKKIPFSSEKTEEILKKFGVKNGTEEAEVMKNTIEECERRQIQGEVKYCATSLESMIDFSTSRLGKHVNAVSTEVENNTRMQSYKIEARTEMINGENRSVVCHKQNYAYVVFYCHETKSTRAFTVSLEDYGGSKVKAVAICHTDTSAWNPKHLAFQVLKVKPGTSPICHFLPQGHIVWVPK